MQIMSDSVCFCQCLKNLQGKVDCITWHYLSGSSLKTQNIAAWMPSFPSHTERQHFSPVQCCTYLFVTFINVTHTSKRTKHDDTGSSWFSIAILFYTSKPAGFDAVVLLGSTTADVKNAAWSILWHLWKFCLP